jgi:hypothetical protein
MTVGVVYSTQGAEFEDQEDRAATSEQFYAVVQVGMLVKIKDERTPDGVADEVEFESEEDLDGRVEFEDEVDEEDEPEEEPEV